MLLIPYGSSSHTDTGTGFDFGVDVAIVSLRGVGGISDVMVVVGY